jgi:4-amino-4-deoxy-L-arabinose transferase-like glycosyltransferase
MAKIIKLLKSQKLLVLIFLLAVLLRFFKLGQIPNGFDGDEAAFGYYGFSLVHNFSDEYGNKLPLYFSSIGDYKYPVYAYLSTIPVLIFGLGEFSTRFLSAFAGSLLVIFLYLLVFEVTRNKRVAIFSSILVAISPYSILFSRGAYESNLATTLIVIGFWWLVRCLNNKSRNEFYFSLIPFILAIFTYSSTRVFLLLFLPVFFLIYRQKSKSLGKLIIIAMTITLISFLNPKSLVRANDIGFLREKFSTVGIETSIREDGYVWNSKYLLITRFFHNKVIDFGLSFAKRYFEHFSPIYLFLDGNPNMPKYSVPGVGLFYFFEVVTISLGLVFLTKVNKKAGIFFVFWILISAIPSSLTIETPNPIRTLVGLPAWEVISAIGLWALMDYIPKKLKKIFYTFLAIVIVANLAYFWHQYSLHKLIHQPWYSDVGVKEMVLEVNKLENSYDKVVISKDPYIFFLFYNKVKPKDFLSNTNITPEKVGTWERVNSFGKVIFKMPMDCPKIGRLNVLYVCRGGEIPINSKLLKTIYFNDKVPAFNLIEFVPLSKSTKDPLPENVHRMVESDNNYLEGILPEDSGRYW